MAEDWAKYLKFRCTGCGNCCRRTIVMLTDSDLDRIIDGTGLPLTSFARFAGEEDAKLDRRSPWWIRFEHAGRRARGVLALRHRPGGACVFLDDDNTCAIYDHRPVTCREHPLQVECSDSGAVTHIALSDIVECPHDWDGALSKRGLRKIADWNTRQSEEFLDEVAGWNRRRKGPKTRPAFLRFLGYDA